MTSDALPLPKNTTTNWGSSEFVVSPIRCCVLAAQVKSDLRGIAFFSSRLAFAREQFELRVEAASRIARDEFIHCREHRLHIRHPNLSHVRDAECAAFQPAVTI